MNETNETKAEILNRGFADEMTAAVEYLKTAGRYGDDMLKQQFLQYAGDELNHAAKILRLMQENDIKAETIDFSESDESLREKMIEYIANEESAVFITIFCKNCILIKKSSSSVKELNPKKSCICAILKKFSNRRERNNG